MLTEQNAREVIGTTAYTSDDEKLGKVGQLFLDDQTGRPEFVTVNTGLFGTNETFVPVSDATFNGGRLVLPFDKAKIKDAPNVDAGGGHLDESEEQRLYEYYGMSYGSYEGGRTGTQTGTQTGDVTTTGNAAGADGFEYGRESAGTAGVGSEVNQHGTEGHDTSGRTTDDAMTRSEEE